MINTVNTKAEQLQNGYFKIDSGNELVLVIGSCRSVPYMNYLHEWNLANNNRFTLCFIDPFNWCFDLQDNRVDLEDKINSLETDENILSLLRSTKIIIHEYYANFGMFCFDKKADNNIYQFGLNPETDICIPNFNDLFIQFNDIVTFDVDLRKKSIQDVNVTGKVSDGTLSEMKELSEKNIGKFITVCGLSDVPEMAEYFLNNFRSKRMWWSYNHVSKNFTLAVFKFINEKFLHLDLSNGFDEGHIDMFANNFTKLTHYDILWHNYEWENEEIVPFKDKLVG